MRVITHIQGNRFDENNEQLGKTVVDGHPTPNRSFLRVVAQVSAQMRH